MMMMHKWPWKPYGNECEQLFICLMCNGVFSYKEAETVYKPLTRPTTIAQWHPRMIDLFQSKPIKGPRL